MSEHELTTEKYLKAAEQAREQRLQEAAGMQPSASESAPADSSAEALLSLHQAIGKVVPVVLVLAVAGWLYTQRASLSILAEPIGVEGATNALLRFNGEDHEFKDTQLGRMVGNGEPIEMDLPEVEPVQMPDELFLGPFDRKREHDDWYKALPGE